VDINANVNIPSTYVYANIEKPEAVSIPISSENVADNTTLNWTIVDTSLPNNTFSSTSGQFTINNGQSNIDFSVTNTYGVSVNGSFKIAISDASGAVLFTSGSYLVDIKVGVNVSTVNEYLTIHEHMSIALPVTEVNVVDNTVVHWNVVRTGMTDSNFSVMSGIYTTGDANLDKYIRFDLLHNDDHDLTGSFHIALTNDNGDVLDTSGEMSVDIKASAKVSDVLSKFDKPGVVNARINTTNVPIGTVLSWKVIHTGTIDANYSQLSGTFTVSENGNNVSFNLLQSTLENIAGSFYLVVYNSKSVEIGRSIVATVDIPVNVSILDLPPVITRSTDLQLSVRLTNVPDISKLHWEIVHTGTSDSNYSRLSGDISPTKNTIVYTTAVEPSYLVRGNVLPTDGDQLYSYYNNMYGAVTDLDTTSISSSVIPTYTYTDYVEPSYVMHGKVLPTDGDQLYSYYNNMYNALSETSGYITNSSSGDGSIEFSIIKYGSADVTGSFYIVIKDDTGRVLYTSGTTLVVMYDNYSITNVPTSILANGNVTMNLTALGATDGAVYNWAIHTTSVDDSIYSSLTGASTISSSTSTINFTVDSAKAITDTIYLTVVDSTNKLVTATRLIPVSIK
jgi:hypothetical protein